MKMKILAQLAMLFAMCLFCLHSGSQHPVFLVLWKKPLIFHMIIFPHKVLFPFSVYKPKS